MSGIKLRPIVFKVDPPYVLLDSKAPATYGQNATLYEPPTFTTDKDFICYKMAVHRDTGTAEIYLTGFDGNNAYGWNWYAKSDGTVQYINEAVYNGTQTPLVAGTDGVRESTGEGGYRCLPNPMIPTSTTDFTHIKFIFQISTRKVYFYINGKQVAICNDWTAAWNPLEQTMIGSIYLNISETFGIDVYACNSLEAAIQC